MYFVKSAIKRTANIWIPTFLMLYERPQWDYKRMNTQSLIDKITALPADRIAEIEDFVDFIHLRERARAVTRAATAASEPAFAAVWNNSDDSAYDAL